MQRRDFLNDRFQCSRVKKGFGAIQIQIICNGDATSTDPLPAQVAAKSTINQCALSRKLASAKRKRAEEVLLSLHCTGRTKSAEECDVLKKNKWAMEIRMRLHEQMNLELANKLKAKKLHLELVECNLLTVEEKIKLAASTLAEYNIKSLKEGSLL
jgi:hypothetical protein